jgi:hypothetical protein
MIAHYNFSSAPFLVVPTFTAMLDGSLVTTASRVRRLKMEESPPVTEGSCKYIEQAVADSRQGVVLQLGCWAWG